MLIVIDCRDHARKKWEKKNLYLSEENSRQTMPKMDPGEDIIDVLYNRPETSQSSKSSGNRSMHRKSMLRRQYSNGLYQYGFEYQHTGSGSKPEVGPNRKWVQTGNGSKPDQYGFEYQHPPTRNYYEDLFQIQRRNFHGSDSVYETANVTKRPLCRTDSIMEVKSATF